MQTRRKLELQSRFTADEVARLQRTPIARLQRRELKARKLLRKFHDERGSESGERVRSEGAGKPRGTPPPRPWRENVLLDDTIGVATEYRFEGGVGRSGFHQNTQICFGGGRVVTRAASLLNAVVDTTWH